MPLRKNRRRASLEGALKSSDLPQRLAWPLCSQRPQDKRGGRTALLVLCSRRPRFRKRSLDGRNGASTSVHPWGRGNERAWREHCSAHEARGRGGRGNWRGFRAHRGRTMRGDRRPPILVLCSQSPRAQKLARSMAAVGPARVAIQGRSGTTGKLGRSIRSIARCAQWNPHQLPR